VSTGLGRNRSSSLASSWASLFHRQRSAIGASLRLNERPATIVGVVSDSADFGVQQILSAAAYARGFVDRDARTRVDVWLPLQADGRAPRGFHGFLMLGRLAAGATPASAQGELTPIAVDLERTHPENAARGVFLEPIEDVVLRDVWMPIALLTAAVALVLLTASVNLAILLLARGTARTNEIDVRLALGADRRRLLRQFIIENVLLSWGGAALGVLLAYGTLRAIRAFAPVDMPRITSADINSSVALIALMVAIIIAVALGLLPLAHIRSSASGLVVRRPRGVTGVPNGRLRSVLVATEIAVAVILLAGAGLLGRSLWHIYHVDPGFDAARVLKAELQLPPARYRVRFGAPAASNSPFTRLVDGFVERAERLPGVEAVAMAAHHPLDAGFTTSLEFVGGGPQPSATDEVSVRGITPGYFATVGVQILGGRGLTQTDAGSSTRSAVVNEAFADRFFSDADPIDRKLQFLGAEWRIVGVAENERSHGLTSPPPIAAYVALNHAPWPRLAIVVRTRSAQDAVVPGLRRAIGEIDPALAMFAVEPLQQTMTGAYGEHRFMTTLLILFATFAVALAAVGVYGVLSYAIARKTSDIAVRIALGADTRQVLGLVLREGAVVTGIGVVAGVGAALSVSGLLSSLLFEVTPTDPLTMGAVVVFVVIVAAAATWFPAKRALGIDPMVAMGRQ
jgi:putative ABC transport system permease protein